MDSRFLIPATASASNKLELLIVEGKSAAGALNRVRERRYQGIFTMQGKIPNPMKVKPEKIHNHEQCGALLALLGGNGARVTSPYARVVIVPDADSDGAHSGYLLASLFNYYLTDWIERGDVYLFKSPLARVNTGSNGSKDNLDPHYLYTSQEIQDWLADKAVKESQTSLTHFKGLASINGDELASLITFPLAKRSARIRISGKSQNVDLPS